MLSGQICQDLDELEYLVVQTTRLAQKAKATGDDDYLGTVALNLHGFYTGTERIFEESPKKSINLCLPIQIGICACYGKFQLRYAEFVLCHHP